MSKIEPMDEQELAAQMSARISDSRSYDESEVSENRDKALKYIEGEMPDIDDEEGKSTVVAYTTRDTIAWILPSIMRVFMASDNVVSYEPQKKEDIPGNEQASQYVNHKFVNEWNGYKVLYDAIYDSLALGNGIIKHWRSEVDEKRTHEFTGLTDDVFTDLAREDNVEIAEHTETVGNDGEILHDVKLIRTVKANKINVIALPPEDFLIGREDTEVCEKTVFVAHIDYPTRSELIERGMNRDLVMGLPAWSPGVDDNAKGARDKLDSRSGDIAHKSVERVRIYECYPLIDYDGDGVAERRQVIMADNAAKSKGAKAAAQQILSNEEWPDGNPFSDIVADPVPHRWRGRSIFDKTADIQKIQTVLQRQTLDNIYKTNNPLRIVQTDAVENPEVLIDNEIGGVVFADRLDAVTEHSTPFFAQHSFQVMSFFDEVLAKRTGVSSMSMGLDPEVLQNQTAEAVAQQHSSSQSMVELYARNIAKLGLTRLFQCLLKLVVAHQKHTEIIKLTGKWVPMDPSTWNAGMRANVNVGLGAGSRDRDMAMLGQIMTIQKTIMDGFGQDNPLVQIPEIRNSFASLIESAGMRSPEMFVRELSEEALMEYEQKQQQKVDPKQQESQMRLQLEQQKAQAKAQVDMQKMQVDAQIEQQKAQAQLQADREKFAAEMEMQRERMLSELTMARERMAGDLELKREQILAEIQLKRDLAAYDRAAGRAGNTATANPDVRVGGDPG
jgi:hypothetical protein